MSLSLLSEIASQGVRICVDGDNLTVAQDNLTDSLLVKIKDKKPSLIASLERLSSIAGDDWQEIVKHPDQVRDLIHSVTTVHTLRRQLLRERRGELRLPGRGCMLALPGLNYLCNGSLNCGQAVGHATLFRVPTSSLVDLFHGKHIRYCVLQSR